MTVSDRTRAIIEPLVVDEGLELFDFEYVGGVLRVTVDQPAAGGVSLSAIAAVTRTISRALDEHDPIEGHFTLEVSSPGLERNLRTPAHFTWAVGRQVSVKTVPTYDGPRRLRGVIHAADTEAVELVLEGDGAEGDGPDGDRAAHCRLAYGDIDKARTVFEWGPTPKKTTKPQKVKAS